MSSMGNTIGIMEDNIVAKLLGKTSKGGLLFGNAVSLANSSCKQASDDNMCIQATDGTRQVQA